MERTPTPTDGFYDLTLAELVSGTEILLEEVAVVLSLGAMLTPRMSGDLSNVSRLVGRLSYFQKQATGALSVLRYWLERNASATTLPIKTPLRNWYVGSAPLMELIEASVMCEFYAGQLSYLVPDLVKQVASELL